MDIFITIHTDWEYGGQEVIGVFSSREQAEDARHWKMRARNKDGSVSFRTNDPRPKVRTLDGCCDIEVWTLDGARKEPEE
jgi:hypothetical protein